MLFSNYLAVLGVSLAGRGVPSKPLISRGTERKEDRQGGERNAIG